MSLERIITMASMTEDEEDVLDSLFAGISMILDRKTANNEYMKRRLEVLNIQVNERITGREAFKKYQESKGG